MNMYTDLTLYYLNQMGIFPWVSKKNYQLNQVDNPRFILIRCLKAEPKIEGFLKQLRHFLGLLHYDTQIWTEEREFDSRNPDAVLVFNLYKYALKEANCPVFSYNLKDIMSHPAKKKTILNDILSLGCTFG